MREKLLDEHLADARRSAIPWLPHRRNLRCCSLNASCGAMTTAYTARFKRSERYWLVQLVEVPGCHSFGATLADARTALVDAMSAWDIDASTVHIVEELPEAIEEE